MADFISPDELNAQADDIASRMVEVAFLSGGVETSIPREALTFAAAGAAGAHPQQVAADGRAWPQMLSVEVPDGVTVDGLAFFDSLGDLRMSRGIPPVTGPLSAWPVSVPVVTASTL